jgi:hypothetical protein
MRRTLHYEIDLDSGILIEEAYRLDGKLHRDPNEGPAYIRRSSEGTGVVEERYCWHGRLHRENGPAYVLYSTDRTVLIDEHYHRHGLLHRDPKEGPAWIERVGSLVVVEEYCFNGQRYRDPADGPCYIGRSHTDGTIDSEEFSEPGAVLPRRDARRTRSGPAPAP